MPAVLAPLGLAVAGRGAQLDQQDAEPAAVAMAASQLILQDWTDEPLVEEPRLTVDDMERKRFRIIDADAAARAVGGAGRHWRAAGGARLGAVRSAPQKVAYRHGRNEDSSGPEAVGRRAG